MTTRWRREQVPEEMTWNLMDLYPTKELWLADLKGVAEQAEEIQKYKGRVTENAEILLLCLNGCEAIHIKLNRLGTYCQLKEAADGICIENQEDVMAYASVAASIKSQIAFIRSELIHLSYETFDAFKGEVVELGDFSLFVTDLLEGKAHMLSQETEEVLAAMGPVLSSPYRIYSVSKATDMIFEDFLDDQGQSVQNSFSLYETLYEYSDSHVIRKNAHASFVKALGQYQNTYGAVYASEIKKQITLSKLRKFQSVTHMLLDVQKVTVEMYHNQIDIIFNALSPHMRRFAQIKQHALGLAEMHGYDLKAPLKFEYDETSNYEETKEIIIDAMGIMGLAYQNIVKEAFDQRWIDYGDNIGKSTGAFCSTPYGVHPYILTSWQDSMRSAFTLAHELGHAGHFFLAHQHQRLVNMGISTYFVEAPSTLNELILGQYLMKKYSDSSMKKWVILQLLGTYYHNFVTHLLEAVFQKRIYELGEGGSAITADLLGETMAGVLRDFWGDAVIFDSGDELTWMRQPHYYMGLYPYTYSAGLSIATAVYQSFELEGQAAVDRWLNVLKSGGSLKPEALAKMAGVDMSQGDPIRGAVNFVGNLIDQLENT